MSLETQNAQKKKRSAKFRGAQPSPRKKPVPRPGLASRSAPKRTSADAQFRVGVERMGSVDELKKMLPGLNKLWKVAAILARIEHLEYELPTFIESLKQMDEVAIQKLIASSCPRWQRDEAEKELRRIRRATVDTASRPATGRTNANKPPGSSATQKYVPSPRRLVEPTDKERARFRLELASKSLEALRSILSSFPHDWKNEEVVRQFEAMSFREEQRAIQEFQSSLQSKSDDELLSLFRSTTDRLRRRLIARRLGELRLRQHSVDVAKLRTELSCMNFEDLLDTALAFPLGWQNEMTCDRIIELLPKAEITDVQFLAGTSDTGLQLAVSRAKAELAVRKENADPIKPRIMPSWTR
jgi:hypothetical protein